MTTALAVALVLIQVIGLNNMALFGVATAFAYIYTIIHLPLTMSQNKALTIAFLMGLTVDIFADTQGMNALACTIIAALRKPALRLYMPRENELADPEPSCRSLGVAVFAKYSLTMALLFCTVIFLVEAFSFFSPLRLILRIICSTILTWAVLMAIDTLFCRRNEKRL